MRRTRSLGGQPRRDLLRLAPDGVWLAAVSPRRWWALTPPFHPYLRRLRRVSIAEGGLLSVPLSVGFRRLGFPQRPALWCPDFPRAPEGPRSPGLRAQLYPRLERAGPQRRAALGTLDRASRMQDELAADEALQADAAQERDELLLQRPVQGLHAHSSLS